MTELKFTEQLQMASLSLYSQFETNLMSNRKVIKFLLQLKSAKDHGKNYIKVRPPWSAIFSVIVYSYPEHILIAIMFGSNVVCQVSQVIPGHGDSQKRRTMFGGYFFKYCCFKYRTFSPGMWEGISVKTLTPKSYLKSFLDASESHKTSANLSVRAYFRQFSDW